MADIDLKDIFDAAPVLSSGVDVTNDKLYIFDASADLLKEIAPTILAVTPTGDQTVAGVKTFSSDPIIPDEAYDATAWNGSLEPPTKNAVRDKFESLSSGLISDTAYDATSWNGVTTIAPSKNAVRDQWETLASTYQPLDSDLTSIAALTTTSFGRAFLALANAAALQAIIAPPRVGTTASSSTPTPDADANDIYTVTALAAGATFGAPTGTPSNGQALMIRVKDNGTARTLAFNAIYRAVGVTLPTTTVISKTVYLGCIFNSADSVWDVIGVAQEA